MIHVLLACGIGASSGFVAARMRKAAKADGLDISIHAVSKSEIMDHVGEFDILLLGPHFSQEVPKYQNLLTDEGVKVMSIDPDYYAELNGEGVLQEALDLYNDKD